MLDPVVSVKSTRPFHGVSFTPCQGTNGTPLPIPWSDTLNGALGSPTESLT